MLPKLLLAIDSITDKDKKTSMLNLLFSAVIIYRQFKVKTQPSATTMLAAYNGECDLDKLKEGEFSTPNIER
jgi:hypothetical protein